jgi:hypothetical protein
LIPDDFWQVLRKEIRDHELRHPTGACGDHDGARPTPVAATKPRGVLISALKAPSGARPLAR